MLDTIITSKTRLKLLLKFFVAAASRGHLRGIAEEFNESTNAIRKELNQLTEAGFLEKQAQQNKVVYHANTQHVLYKPLQNLMRSFLGIEDYVDTILERSGQVEHLALIGSFASGLDNGEIEVLVLGENLNTEYLYKVADKIKAKIGKNIILHFSRPDGVVSQIVLYDVNQS